MGSGPNGLAAALVLARAGHSVKVFEGQPTAGGGARSAALTLPGFVHDVCSAIHPLAAASPFFQSLELSKHGVELVHSPSPLAHPLDGDVVMLERSVEATAAQLGPDEDAYVHLMRPFVDRFVELRPLLFDPQTLFPKSPLLTARFGLAALSSVESFTRRFQSPRTRALFAGCAAHSVAPLTHALTNAFALVLLTTGHAVGWPLIRGGSQKLVDALVGLLLSAGGELETGHPITRLEELPESRLVLFDTHAQVMAHICGDALPKRTRATFLGFRRAPGVFKCDYALSGPMPWSAPEVGRAATVHVGGSLEELVASEAAPARGVLSPRPNVLVAQHTPFDSSRAPAGQHTLWAYCHVPNGSQEDATAHLEAQLERFAPGWRGLVLARSVKTPADLEASNASYLGGDITGGAVDGLQALARPTLRPYVTPNPRLLLCSSSAPPGPGVHGMCGFHAAQVALERLRSP